MYLCNLITSKAKRGLDRILDINLGDLMPGLDIDRHLASIGFQLHFITNAPS